MIEIESKILRAVQKTIFWAVFFATAPIYTDQPEAVLKHVYQIATDVEGNKTSCLVQDYFTQIMAAIQPFIQERTFWINTAEKFKNHLDPDQFPFFRRQAHPFHTSVMPLDAFL